MDPFVHEAAMHTGIDFRGDIGEPIHATAAGTVTIAGWSGGYGKMVEIDHGNGSPPATATFRRSTSASATEIRIGQVIGKHRLDRPFDRPASCITRRASTARRSIRRNSSTPATSSTSGG